MLRASARSAEIKGFTRIATRRPPFAQRRTDRRPRMRRRLADGCAQAMDLGARRTDQRALGGFIDVRIGLETGDQLELRIDRVARAPIGRIAAAPKIPCPRWRRRGDERKSQNDAKRNKPHHGYTRAPTSL